MAGILAMSQAQQRLLVSGAPLPSFMLPVWLMSPLCGPRGLLWTRIGCSASHRGSEQQAPTQV